MSGLQRHWISMVLQPVQPGRKIYPAPCKACAGKGRIKEAANRGGLHLIEVARLRFRIQPQGWHVRQRHELRGLFAV